MKNTILIILVIALSGCTSMQTVNSLNQNVKSHSNYRYYDSDSKIRYRISNNENYLFLTFNTTNKASIMKIVKTGFTIYFDSNGKKKKQTYIQYPLEKMAKLEQGKKGPDQRSKPQKMNLSSMLSGVPREAIYYKDESKYSIDLATDTSGLEVSLKEDHGDFTYVMKVPFTKIANGGFNSLKDLVIGVESGKFEMPSQRSAQSGSGMQSGGGGKGGGGGHGGGGKSGGMGNGRGTEDSQSSEMTIPIKFWFKVSLFY